MREEPCPDGAEEHCQQLPARATCAGSGVTPTPAPAHPSRQSWSRSQWDTADKEGGKGSKNKPNPAQCPIPLRTGAAPG